MPNIIAVMPIHGRERLTRETIRILRRQKFVSKVVVSGDSPLEADIAKNAGAVFTHCANEPLSFKFQAALDKAREFGPDAVLICGSDNFLSPRWTETCMIKMREGFDVVGKNRHWQVLAFPGSRISMYEFQYLGAHEGEPHGAGRMISSAILDRAEWKIYRIARNRGCDRMSFEALVSLGARVAVLNDESGIELTNIRTDSENVTAFSILMKRAKARDGIALISKMENDPEAVLSWSRNYFPDFIARLKSAVPECHVGDVNNSFYGRLKGLFGK